MAGVDETTDSTTTAIMLPDPSSEPHESACVVAPNTTPSSGTASQVASTTGSSITSSQQQQQQRVDEEDLWKDASLVDVPDHPGVKIQWFELKEKFVVYARAISVSEDTTTTGSTSTSEQQQPQGESSSARSAAIRVGQVVELMVDETWKRTAKAILEEKKHFPTDAFPPARQLLELGSVWLLDEERYRQGQGAHAQRLHLSDEAHGPDWTRSTLRIYTRPERHYAADWVDWGKFGKGLLLNHEISVTIAGVQPHIPIVEGGALPDGKDGVIVYEDDELGFAVLNKPGNVPLHPTLSNNSETVISKFSMVLHDKKKQLHVSVPNHYPEIDTEAHGLLCLSTKPSFSAYMTNLLKQHGTHAASPPPKGESKSPTGLNKVYKCLVCVNDPDRMDLLEAFQESGKLITHFCDSTHHRYVRTKPKETTSDDGGKRNHWHKCQLRIKQVGDEKFRAACVSTLFADSMDSCLAHRLWGPTVKTDVQYVMELLVEVVGRYSSHQVRGQLAALGFPIVGDFPKGGGRVSVFHEHHEWNHMALQCCELSFPVPVASGNQGEAHQAGEGQCVFRLNNAWWSEYLRQYELYHVRG